MSRTRLEDLFEAIINKDPDFIESELATGFDINKTDEEGNTALIKAVESYNLGATELLLKHGADLNRKNKAGETAFMIAVINNSLDIMKALIDKGVDLNVYLAMWDTMTPLMLASRNNSLELVQLFLEHGADVNFTSPDHTSALILAKKVPIAKLLLDNGANVNQVNDEGDSPLLEAIKSENSELVGFLLEKGANLNQENKKGETALSLAKGLEKGANINEENDENERGVEIIKLLHEYSDSGRFLNALEKGDIPFIVSKLAEGIDINTPDLEGNTALIIATRNEKLDLVKLLIEKGADINHKNEQGESALMIAIKRESKVLIEYLIETKIEHDDDDSKIPLIVAAETSNLELIKMIFDISPELDREALFNIVDNFDPAIKQLMLDADPWNGFSRSDIEKLDTIFGYKEVSNATEEGRLKKNLSEQIQKDFSICPICLKHVEHTIACNYMSHICSKLPGYYHKELYEKYKNERGYISWCTICNRTTNNQHFHYPLCLANGPKPVANSKIVCGGLFEKFLRFRRLREYALELQEENNEIMKTMAMNQLMEETWNAPLMRKATAKRLFERKEWNHPSSQFPERITATTPVIFPNVVRPRLNRGLVPTEINSGYDFITMEENVPVIQFHHKQRDGAIYDHDDTMLSQTSLQSFIISQTNIYEEEFGYCFVLGCEAKLYPEEIRPYVTDAIYQNYKSKFNEKFKSGGGDKQTDIFVEAEAECSLPKKRGGKTKKRQLILKTRKNKQKNTNNSRRR